MSATYCTNCERLTEPAPIIVGDHEVTSPVCEHCGDDIYLRDPQGLDGDLVLDIIAERLDSLIGEVETLRAANERLRGERDALQRSVLTTGPMALGHLQDELRARLYGETIPAPPPTALTLAGDRGTL